jgi:3-phosphoshikimate 1-carboxyvinyltransferase
LEIPDDAVVIADRALPLAVLDALDESLPDGPILVDAGEALKTLQSIERLAGQVLERRASKPMTIVAIGGGSVGDAAGFLASILWRGVGLWHVPTTLLAMVDSAHGGKTAVNLGAAKNQLGTFYPAERVILVDEILETLPVQQRRDGLFELIKGLWLGDAEALDLLDAQGGAAALGYGRFPEVSPRLMELVERAVAVKETIVARDPREQKGIRTVLNLGHTVAHALELMCGLSHGQAVGWGLLAAAGLSAERAGLSAAAAERLRRHVTPLMQFNQALSAVVEAGDSADFARTLLRDKKRADGQLRSVLLDAPGEPLVTREITAQQWFDALSREFERWRSLAITLAAPTVAAPQPGEASGATSNGDTKLEVEASKSELNRAQIIAHLHPSEIEIRGRSSAADVFYLQRALAEISSVSPSEDVAVYCGEGGTTLRFLLALAASRPGATRLYAHRRLLKRPHAPLVEALREGGAEVTEIDDARGAGFQVRGWRIAPERLSIPGHTSSQFASALAMLGALGKELRLHVTFDGADRSEIVSEPYFEMTLEMLRRVGLSVDSTNGSTSRDIVIRPGPEFDRAGVLEAAADASSAAVWSVASFLGVPVEVANLSRPSLQPDSRIDEVLAALRDSQSDSASDQIDLDLHECPDLAPVVAVAALAVPAAVRIGGVAHLRHKESNRIEDLVRAFAMAGVEIEPREDGILVPAGVQRATSGARIATFGDHRLAMAALLLSAAGAELTVDDPWVVAKSYPSLWSDARRAGWSVVQGG